MLRLQVLAIRRALHLVDNWDEARYNAVVVSGGAEGAGPGPPRPQAGAAMNGESRALLFGT